MRGRLSAGLVSIVALLLGVSSLGLTQVPRAILAQNPTATPTATPIIPTSTPTATAVSPTSTATGTSLPPGPTTPPPGPTTPPPGGQPTAKPPKPQGEPATPSIGIKVNRCARVVGPDGLSLNQGPGLTYGHVQTVGRNDIVLVTDGPQRSDGLWWWKVVTREGVMGWGINDHLSPYSGECFGDVTVATASAPSAAPLLTVAPGNGVEVVATAPGSQDQLPATGARDEGLLFGGALITAILLVVGLIRRRTQTPA